jgi:spore coat protein CotH
MIQLLRSAIAICLMIKAALSMHAQSIPDFGPVFPQDEVTAIYLTIDADSLNQMIANLENEHEFPATFVFESTSLVDTVASIGLRLRGNTSLNAAKKSFKISFNTFDNGGDWQGLEKLNLLATVNDPSLMRSKLSHDLYRKYGIAAARTSYTRLYINNEYRGLYLNIEHIDEQMASTYFDNQGDGNLYKCTYPADLDFISNNPDDYKFALWGTRHYELTTNDYLDDYTDLSEFIAVLNNTPSENLSCALPTRFHISEYLKIAAIDVLLGNWDDHIYLKNNFYIYHDQLTDKLRFIPYDLDNTLGIDWIGVDWSTRPLYTWSAQGENRPLYTRLMENVTYRGLFSKHIDELCSTLFHPDTLASQMEHWQSLIAAHVEADPYYPLDFGFTMQDFYNAALESCCNHVPFGILAYVEARRASALAQLESYAQSADTYWIAQRIDTNAVSLRARLDGSISSVQANYSWDGDSFNSGTMTAAGEGLYSYEGPLFNTSQNKLYYRAIVNGNLPFPCTPDFHWITRSPVGVRINEACASNSTIVADNAGEYDDWVELYNTTSDAIPLSHYFLTDDPSNWNRWQLPDTLLPANGFLLFWLDDDLEQGRHHANFKLSASEELLLYRSEEGKPRIVDRAGGFSPTSDQTWALQPDGGSASAYSPGTPGITNVIGITSNLIEPAFNLYPCPAQTSFFWPLKNLGKLYHADGQLVSDSITYGSNACGNLSEGVYLVISDEKAYRLVIAR